MKRLVMLIMLVLVSVSSFSQNINIHIEKIKDSKLTKLHKDYSGNTTIDLYNLYAIIQMSFNEFSTLSLPMEVIIGSGENIHLFDKKPGSVTMRYLNSYNITNLKDQLNKYYVSDIGDYTKYFVKINNKPYTVLVYPDRVQFSR
jgi:hypothetical protein